MGLPRNWFVKTMILSWTIDVWSYPNLANPVICLPFVFSFVDPIREKASTTQSNKCVFPKYVHDCPNLINHQVPNITLISVEG
jgi:hypothetical protein